MDDVDFPCFLSVPNGETLRISKVGRGNWRLSFRLTGSDQAIRWAESVIRAGTAVITVDKAEYWAKFQYGSRSCGEPNQPVCFDMMVSLTPINE